MGAPVGGELICPLCGRQAICIDSKEVYGRSHGQMWICPNRPCSVYVGCHLDSNVPKGTLATPAMREARKTAHSAFDRLWKTAEDGYEIHEKGLARGKVVRRIRRTARNRAYKWLAAQLGIHVDDCHIGMFDIDTCARVFYLCQGVNSWDIRDWHKGEKNS